MENSVMEKEGDQSFKSPPKRRRSTFFIRRDSLVPQPLSENAIPNVSRNLDENIQKQNEDLARYHEKLMAEKEQWKSEVIDRRCKYHDIRQQYQMTTKGPKKVRLSYSTLTNEDIAFLNDKVNISRIVESQGKLHKSIKATQALHQRAMELDNVILSHCEEKVNEITNYVLDNSTI